MEPYELIGKEFSKETIEARKILTDKGIDFKFVDIDFEEHALHWLKANKITALPVLKKDDRFVVGVKDMELLLSRMK